VAVVRASPVYLTPPWGKIDQPPFLNMAALVETMLSAHALLTVCLHIELEMGRRRTARWGPRTLDVDILTYADATIDEPDLKTPHPRLTERAFVLEPLAAIAPHLRIAGQDVRFLLSLVDRAGVEVDLAASARVGAAFRSINV
jgi:2-amino-4-hydroxy-6-hydroxymethyldihydropteridine diphosphokinase